MNHLLGHFVNNERCTLTSERTSPVYDPATGQSTAKVLLADKADVHDVADIAHRAFNAWQQVTPLNRARVLFRYRELLLEHQNTLAELISQEHGKTLDDALGEISRGIEVVEFACGIPHLLKGKFTQNVGSHIDAWSIRSPVGVVAGITPFNFPVMVPLWMFPIAIACGNAFILKPSEKAPSAPLFMAELLKESGLPAGVFNVVNGDKETVDALLSHPIIHAISFVGSTPVAEHIYRTAAAHGKRVQALGGAKNHLVVMPDSDIDSCANALIGAAFGSAGERCMAISVAVAVGDIAPLLIERLAQKISNLKVAAGKDNPDMGPVISAAHKTTIEQAINLGTREGASLVIDGRQHPLAKESSGFFIGPSLFDHVGRNMQLYQKEIFGPVLCVVRVNTLDEAIALINQNPYGNGASIFTESGHAARQFSQAIQIGMVGVNVPIPVPAAFHSFGGWKQSNFGQFPIHGMEGVRFYTRLKTVTAKWPDKQGSQSEFTLPTLK